MKSKLLSEIAAEGRYTPCRQGNRLESEGEIGVSGVGYFLGNFYDVDFSSRPIVCAVACAVDFGIMSRILTTLV